MTFRDMIKARLFREQTLQIGGFSLDNIFNFFLGGKEKQPDYGPFVEKQGGGFNTKEFMNQSKLGGRK